MCTLDGSNLHIQVWSNGTVSLSSSTLVIQTTTVANFSLLTRSTTTIHASHASCEIARSYDNGVGTSELFTSTDSGGIDWTFSSTLGSKSLEASADTRIPASLATTIDIVEWSTKNQWWMPLTSPSNRPRPDGSAPFSPMSRVTNNTDNMNGSTTGNDGGLFYNYGGFKFGLDNDDGLPNLAGTNNGYVIPLLTFLKQGCAGLSFFENNKTLTTYADIYINQHNNKNGARFIWTRRLLGFNGNKVIKFVDGHFFAHEDDWRPALGEYWKHEGASALPNPNVDLSLTEGAATYAYYFDQPSTTFENIEYYQEMDLTMKSVLFECVARQFCFFCCCAILTQEQLVSFLFLLVGMPAFLGCITVLGCLLKMTVNIFRRE